MKKKNNKQFAISNLQLSKSKNQFIFWQNPIAHYSLSYALSLLSVACCLLLIYSCGSKETKTESAVETNGKLC